MPKAIDDYSLRLLVALVQFPLQFAASVGHPAILYSVLVNKCNAVKPVVVGAVAVMKLRRSNAVETTLQPVRDCSYNHSNRDCRSTMILRTLHMCAFTVMYEFCSTCTRPGSHVASL